MVYNYQFLDNPIHLDWYKKCNPIWYLLDRLIQGWWSTTVMSWTCAHITTCITRLNAGSGLCYCNHWVVLHIVGDFNLQPQLSWPVAHPVAFGAEESEQLILPLAGQVMSGSVVSTIQICWMQDVVFRKGSGPGPFKYSVIASEQAGQIIDVIDDDVGLGCAVVNSSCGAGDRWQNRWFTTDCRRRWTSNCWF